MGAIFQFQVVWLLHHLFLRLLNHPYRVCFVITALFDHLFQDFVLLYLEFILLFKEFDHLIYLIHSLYDLFLHFNYLSYLTLHLQVIALFLQFIVQSQSPMPFFLLNHYSFNF